MTLVIITSTIYAGSPVKPVYPEVGKPCPDLVINNITAYPGKKAKISDFRGKWLVLDLWSKGCGGCISALPRINDMQKTFGDKVQFIVVGREDRENGIRAIYARFQKKLNLTVSAAFDSTLFTRLDVSGVPYIIVIDPRGVVQGITGRLEAEDMTDFLAGRSPRLVKVYREHEKHISIYDPKLPFLVKGNGGNDTDYFYRSMWAKWNPEAGYGHPSRVILEHGKFEAISITARELYLMAYTDRDWIGFRDSLYGRFWPKPLLEMKDTSLFYCDFSKEIGLFSYSLTVPPPAVAKETLMQMIQRDLKNCFRLDAGIETRKMPYWRLVATEEARIKLRTKGQTVWPVGRVDTGFTAKNFSMPMFLLQITREVKPDCWPIIDETGIEGNLDITMDCVLTDFDSVKQALRANGLDLVKGEKDMQVLVIRDCKN